MTEMNVGAMLGLTLVRIDGMYEGSDEVIFESECGRTFKLHHWQDCCESVRVEDVVGDPNNLIGLPLLMSREDSSEGWPAPGGDYPPESYTWTFYNFATQKGYVTLRWLGESNGYYSERVDFVEVDRWKPLEEDKVSGVEAAIARDVIETAVGNLRSVYTSDAPSGLNSDEAYAWMLGWNDALAALLDQELVLACDGCCACHSSPTTGAHS